MGYITLQEYAKRNNRHIASIRRHIRDGNLKCCRIDGVTMIDENQRYIDVHLVANKRINNLTNQKFGKLTARSLEEIRKGVAYWRCDCECGSTVVVLGRSLVSGNTKSCGCLNGSEEHIAKTSANSAKYHVDQTITYLLTSKPHRNNTSGRRGVSFRKDTKKWIAYIRINNKFIRLGTYALFDDAVKAREEAEDKYFKPYTERKGEE